MSGFEWKVQFIEALASHSPMKEILNSMDAWYRLLDLRVLGERLR